MSDRPSSTNPSLALAARYPYADVVQAHARAILAEKIAASGMSRSQYAKTVLLRSSKTLHGWLSGKPIPRAVLLHLIATSPETPTNAHAD